MQTEVPTLPIVHFNAPKNLNRKQNSNLGRSSVETKSSSAHKNIIGLSPKKKTLHPLLGRPYQSNIRQCHAMDQSRINKNTLEQKVLSAKMLRIKELQNQLADAHYQLNELANENKLLKALQKRQDSALKRYEGTNAELPRIINSHHEELRVLQIKYKKLKVLQKETCELLKEKENELLHLQSQNKHLLQLSKDRNLGEREKLQLQVSDLNHRIQEQQDTIQTLHRKLALETKSLKQQLQLEISKRKETQKHLIEATEKLTILENFLDNRERRLYYNGQLLFPDKNRRFGTQSLTNLRDISLPNAIKLEKSKKWHTNDADGNLPVLHMSELNNKVVKGNETLKSSQMLDNIKTETMENLDQVRKYRLQKSVHAKVLLKDAEEEGSEVLSCEVPKITGSLIDLEGLEIKRRTGQESAKEVEISADKFKKIYKNRKRHDSHELPKDELAYRSGGSESENERNNSIDASNDTKELHARWSSSTDETLDSKELTSFDYKYADKLKVLVQERNNSYESDTETESEMKGEAVKHYLINQQNDGFKSISSMNGNESRCNSNKKKEIPLETVLNEPQMCYKGLIDKTHMKNRNTEDNDMYAQYSVKDVQMEYTNSGESAKHNMFNKTVSDEHDYNYVSVTEDDAKNTLLLQASLQDKDNFNVEAMGDKPDKLHTSEILPHNSQPRAIEHVKKNSFDDADIKRKINKAEMGILDKNIFSETYTLEAKNKFNEQEFGYVQPNNDSSHGIFNTSSTVEENTAETRVTNYNKEKLLASMKAIDDNENIEFLNQDYERQHSMRRKQTMGDIFLQLPPHMKKKQDIIKDIFDSDLTKNESTGSCNT